MRYFVLKGDDLKYCLSNEFKFPSIHKAYYRQRLFRRIFIRKLKLDLENLSSLDIHHLVIHGIIGKSYNIFDMLKLCVDKYVNYEKVNSYLFYEIRELFVGHNLVCTGWKRLLASELSSLVPGRTSVDYITAIKVMVRSILTSSGYTVYFTDNQCYSF